MENPEHRLPHRALFRSVILSKAKDLQFAHAPTDCALMASAGDFADG